MKQSDNTTVKTTKKQIDRFLEPKKLAIAGVSRDKKKFGFTVFKELVINNFDVIPINPNTTEIDGQRCYSSVEELPSDIQSLLILTPKQDSDAVLRAALQKGIPNIWVQQFSETNNTLSIAHEYEQKIIYKKCIFMFAKPVMGFHKFHRTIVQIFGSLPK